MEANVYVENSKKQQPGAQLSNQFYQDCLAALGGAGEDAAMVLDDRGEVLFCNDEGATIFGSTPDKVAGRHLSEFVPNIRLNAWTPGNNVAYAAFSGRRNQWREYCVLDAKGQGFPVELLLDVLVVNLRYLILLWVRTPAKQTGSAKRSATKKLPDNRILDGQAVGMASSSTVMSSPTASWTR